MRRITHADRMARRGREKSVNLATRLLLAAAIAIVAVAPASSADDAVKRGGTLNYVVPADAPPSFDGHREATYATVHTAAPFYSVLIRVNPNNPASPTDFVCDL